jgi:hypothetical protein
MCNKNTITRSRINADRLYEFLETYITNKYKNIFKGAYNRNDVYVKNI